MPPVDPKVVQLFPARGALGAPVDLRCREMGGDIASLRTLSQRLQLMRAPLREASHALSDASHHEIGPRAGRKLEDLDALLGALDGSMKQLVDAMTAHQASLRHDERIHG